MLMRLCIHSHCSHRLGQCLWVDVCVSNIHCAYHQAKDGVCKGGGTCEVEKADAEMADTVEAGCSQSLFSSS